MELIGQINKSENNMLVSRLEFDSFIFTHIPKCGGTSFRRFINKCALNSGINRSEIYIPGENKLPHSKNLTQLNELEAKQISSIKWKVIANHSHFHTHLEYKLNKIRNPFYYTILREPVSRFISHYNFFYYKLGYAECKGIRLNDLKEDKLILLLERLSNVETFYLSNIKLRKVFGYDNVLKVAKYNLQYEYPCFGLLEYLDDSLKILKKKSPNWLLIEDKMPFKNKNKSSRTEEVKEEVVKLIRTYNNLDISLYEFALNLFQKTSI